MNDDGHLDDTERRVRDAVAAHGRTVAADEDGSMVAIRQRVAAARRRRVIGGTALGAAAALVIGIAIGAAVGDDDTPGVAAGGPSTTVPEPCPDVTTTTVAGSTTVGSIGADGSDTTTVTTVGSTTDAASNGAGGPSTSVPSVTVVVRDGTSVVVPEGASSPSTTVPPASEEIIHEEEQGAVCGPGTTTAPPSTPTTATTQPAEPVLAVFPLNGLVAPGQPWPWPDPESTAKAFLDELGVVDPALGPFQSAGPNSGSIELHVRDGNGVVRTDIVRSLLHMARVGDHWAVLSAESESIVVDQTALDGTGLTVTGRGRGFEGTLHLQLIGHGDVVFRREALATASGDIQLRPFTAAMDLAGATSQVGTLVVANDSGDTGGPGDITAVAIKVF
jgi:hypothetical protein